jgi:RND family efflux transporter MFP subunit
MNQIDKVQEATDDGFHSDCDAEAPQNPALERGRRRTAIRVGVATILGLALAIGWGAATHIARSASAHAALLTRETAVPLVRTMDVATERGPRIVDLPGTMQAFDSATLYARATGYIAQRNVDIGSKVHRGDVLVVIAAPDLDQQLAQARGQLGQMQAALQQARANRLLADANNRRTSRLVVEGWNSMQQGDTDRTTLATQSAGVTVAQANIIAQQAEVNRLVELTGFERVTAPFDGVITSRQIDVGTLVTADQSTGTPLFSIARTNVLRVQVYVPQEYFFGLKDGQDATVTVPQLPGRVFHGTVARNAGALSTDTRTLLAEVDVNNADGALSPGLFGVVHFQEPRDRPVIIVPSEAIIFNQNGLSAAVFADGRAIIRPLTILADDGAQVEVRAGLQPGDKVILTPPVNLTSGMRVRAS